MKIIAISQRVHKIHEYGELRDELDNRLFKFVNKLGFLPVPIPNFKKKNNADFKTLLSWLNSIKPSGIILSGGEDIGQFKYRDQIEFKLLNWAVKNKTPIIGICRGMQIIGHWAKVKTIKVKNHVGARHIIISSINKNYKRKVNSFHNLALSKCPKNFKVNFRSLDGVIESIEWRKKKIFGCMWHPEREKQFDKHDISKFKSFLKK